MKRYFHLFILVSFVFLILALAEIDYLRLPCIHSPVYLVVSLTFLFLGFMAEAFVWKLTSQQYGCPISFSDSLASIGLSVFGKYIPGKVWLIMGRIVYLNQHYPYSLKKLAYVTLVSQLLIVWLGLGVGLIGIWNMPALSGYIWVLFVFWALSFVILIHPFAHDKVSQLIERITHGRIRLPVLGFRVGLSLIPFYLARWILFSTAYYFLMISLLVTPLPWYVGTVFPLAGTLGMLIFFVPGGIGVREGIMVFLLSHMGIDIGPAVGLSIAARLWSMLGETMIFTFGFFFRRRSGLKASAE